MSEPNNVDVVMSIYAAFSRGDVAAVLSLVGPDAELQFEGPSEVAWAGNWRGRQGWTTFFETIGRHLDDVSLAMEPFAAQGDKVVVAGRYRGRVKRTGHRIDSPLVHLWTLQGGKVARCIELTNTAAEASACAPATATVP